MSKNNTNKLTLVGKQSHLPSSNNMQSYSDQHTRSQYLSGHKVKYDNNTSTLADKIIKGTMSKISAKDLKFVQSPIYSTASNKQEKNQYYYRQQLLKSSQGRREQPNILPNQTQRLNNLEKERQLLIEFLKQLSQSGSLTVQSKSWQDLKENLRKYLLDIKQLLGNKKSVEMSEANLKNHLEILVNMKNMTSYEGDNYALNYLYKSVNERHALQEIILGKTIDLHNYRNFFSEAGRFLLEKLTKSQKIQDSKSASIIRQYNPLQFYMSQCFKDILNNRFDPKHSSLKYIYPKIHQQVAKFSSQLNEKIKRQLISAKQGRSQKASSLSAKMQKLQQQNQKLKQFLSKQCQSCKKLNQQEIPSLKLAYQIKMHEQKQRLRNYTNSVQNSKINAFKVDVQKIRDQLQNKDQYIKSLEDIIKKGQDNIGKLKKIEVDYNQLLKDYSKLKQEADEAKQKESKICIRIQQKTAENTRLIKNLEDEAQKYDKLAQSHTALTNDLKLKKQQLNKKENQFRDSKQMSSKLDTQKQNELKSKLHMKESEISKLSEIIQIKEKQIKSLNDIIQQLKDKTCQKDQLIKDMKKQLQQGYNMQSNSALHIQQAKTRILQIQFRLKAQTKQKLMLIEEKQKYEKKLKSKDQEIQDLTNTLNNFHQMLQEKSELKCDQSFTNEQKHYASQIKQLQQQIQILNQKLKTSSDKINKLEKQLTMKEKDIFELTNSSSFIPKKKSQEINLTLKSLQQQNKKLKSKIESVSQINEGNTDEQTRINQLYQHLLLAEYSHHKKFLTEAIEDRMNLRIKKTNLIFCYDPLSKVNFHQYIDNLINLVLIVKTKSGMFLGGFTEGAFTPKKMSNKDGIIISLTNKKCFFPLEQNRRAITYDDYYIIFGNSQIRLKSLENKVFSNFAINNSYYNCKGQKVTVLFGGGPQDREVDIQSYEIYQIIFNDL